MKTVLITGGARGIGKACVIAFAKLGYNVVVGYNTSGELAQQTVLEAQSFGANAIAIKADISSFEQTKKMVVEACAKFGNIDILVNNAGVALQKLLIDCTEEDYNKIFDTNLRGVFNCCNAVLPQMMSNQSGKIVNVSSMWGVTGGSCEVLYSASKAGIIGFTKALAKEVALSNINVNCVAPGVILTDMMKSASQQTLAQLKEETPLNRLGEPQDVASAVVFLASEQASFITGEVVNVNGGIVI
ncbi:MAG: 3-oxoacyl-ACP reductase FabG [Clostridia bacterium]